MKPIDAFIVVTKNGTHVHRMGSSGIYLTKLSAKTYADRLNATPSHYSPYEAIPVTISLKVSDAP